MEGWRVPAVAILKKSPTHTLRLYSWDCCSPACWWAGLAISMQRLRSTQRASAARRRCTDERKFRCCPAPWISNNRPMPECRGKSKSTKPDGKSCDSRFEFADQTTARQRTWSAQEGLDHGYFTNSEVEFENDTRRWTFPITQRGKYQ